MASLIRTRAEEIQSERVKVERETTQDYEAIMDRLRNADSVKQAALMQQRNEIQSELEAIDRLSFQVSTN